MLSWFDLEVKSIDIQAKKIKSLAVIIEQTNAQTLA